jgi:hypothetical protein
MPAMSMFKHRFAHQELVGGQFTQKKGTFGPLPWYKKSLLMSSNILFAKNNSWHLKGNDPIWTIDDFINL